MVLGCAPLAMGHDVITTKITWNREILRIIYARCASRHRPGGSAFSLMKYDEGRPWAKAIQEEVLERRMPPWGAVKGFGDFRSDQGLTAEQLELIVDWEEGGAPEGEEKDLPDKPKIAQFPGADTQGREIAVSGDWTVRTAFELDGLMPKVVPDGASFQITAEMPDGSVEPLLWLMSYKKQFGHPFLLRRPLRLPAGTVIRGVPNDATIALLSGKGGHHRGSSAGGSALLRR